MLNNFLKSGFVFTNNDNELKLKYQLFNSLLALNMIVVFTAALMRLNQGEISQAVFDFIYSFFALIIIFLARKYKNKLDLFIKITIFLSLIIVSLTFSLEPNSISGISWFTVQLMVVVFLTSKRFSYIIFGLILIIIAYIIYINQHQGYTFSSFIHGIIPLLVSFIFLQFYEQRNQKSKKLLKEQNDQLQYYAKEQEKYLNIISKHVNYSKTDLEGNITEVSDRFCEMSQYDKKELIGQQHNIIRHPDMPSSSFEIMWNTIQAGKEWYGQVKNKKKDGNFYWGESIITPEFDNNNNIKSYMAIRHDITAAQELKDLVTNLETIVKEEVDKNKKGEELLIRQSQSAALGDMMDAIAHQWKQPLGVINLHIQSLVLRSEYGVVATKEDIEEIKNGIEKQTAHLLLTIDEFRKFFRPNQVRSLMNIKTMIDSTLLLMKDNLISSKIDVEILGNKNIELLCAPNEFKHIFINLINNSKDAFDENNINNRKIIFEIIQEDNIIIKISDNAGGIPEHIINKIFDSNFTTKEKTKGSGIGLYLTKQIIDKLNAKITVENIDGGACFAIIK